MSDCQQYAIVAPKYNPPRAKSLFHLPCLRAWTTPKPSVGTPYSFMLGRFQFWTDLFRTWVFNAEDTRRRLPLFIFCFRLQTRLSENNKLTFYMFTNPQQVISLTLNTLLVESQIAAVAYTDIVLFKTLTKYLPEFPGLKPNAYFWRMAVLLSLHKFAALFLLCWFILAWCLSKQLFELPQVFVRWPQ